jgi:Kdo2-lipid IVA lauroyltransferase/acyltransferase
MRRLRRLRHSLQFAAFRAAIALLAALPFRARVAFCSAVARVAGSWKFDGIARENLKIAFGDSLSREKRKEIRVANARALGRQVAEIVDYMRDGTACAQRLVFADESIARLDEALARGRGAVVVTPHFGNWELFPAFIVARTKVGGGVVARTPSNPHFAKYMEDMRMRARVPTFDSLRARRRILEVLHQGGIVGLLPDLDAKRVSGTFLPFFGKPAWTATGPAHLVVAAQSALITAYMIPEGARYRLVFEEAILPDPKADKHEEILRLTRAWSERFEAKIRERPELWVWMHPRWETTPEKAEERRRRRGAAAERAAAG